MVEAKLVWIGIRPEKRAPVMSLQKAQLIAGSGIAGDHYHKPGGDRQVTLIRWEDLEHVRQSLAQEAVSPERARRNLVVKGWSELVQAGKNIRVGKVLLEITGLCPPCEQMNIHFGPGGREALLERGGLTARIVEGGNVHVHDTVTTV